MKKLMRILPLVSRWGVNMEYIYGVHCGDENCYACATQRYNCNELDKLDNISDREEEHIAVSKYEGME
tara:strand:+ start:181 stop:384 length:204 start_codon:yes stop_codon:yes gene_type:complete